MGVGWGGVGWEGEGKRGAGTSGTLSCGKDFYIKQKTIFFCTAFKCLVWHIAPPLAV